MIPRQLLVKIGGTVLICGAVAVAIWLIPPAGWTTNDITTSAAPDYPDLTSRVYDMAPAQTIEVAAAVATQKLGWKIVQSNLAGGVLSAEAKTPLGLFTDDVIVTVTPKGDNSLVTIRSHSRVGRADLGENARHIRALQAAMDGQLNRTS
jgi:uncharacterized protein (DUF1499 family)